MKQQSFAALFRQSTFARWAPTRQPVKPSAIQPKCAPTNRANCDEQQRPTHYGLKYDPPRRLWGRACGVVKSGRLDGEYGGLGLVEHCGLEPIQVELLAMLQRVHSTRPPQDPLSFGINDAGYAPPMPASSRESGGREAGVPKYWTGPTVFSETRMPVVARLIRRADSGYLMSVAGMDALLPAFEMPKYCQFSMDDVVRKRAFKVFVKDCVWGHGRFPKLTLSFYDQ